MNPKLVANPYLGGVGLALVACSPARVTVTNSSHHPAPGREELKLEQAASDSGTNEAAWQKFLSGSTKTERPIASSGYVAVVNNPSVSGAPISLKRKNNESDYSYLNRIFRYDCSKCVVLIPAGTYTISEKDPGISSDAKAFFTIADRKDFAVIGDPNGAGPRIQFSGFSRDLDGILVKGNSHRVLLGNMEIEWISDSSTGPLAARGEVIPNSGGKVRLTALCSKTSNCAFPADASLFTSSDTSRYDVISSLYRYNFTTRSDGGVGGGFGAFSPWERIFNDGKWGLVVSVPSDEPTTRIISWKDSSAIREGETFLVRTSFHRGVGIRIAGSGATESESGMADIVVSDISFTSIPDLAVSANYMERGLLLDTLKLVRAEGLPVSTTAGATHTQNMGGDLIVENCDFSSQMDDAINFHTRFLNPVSMNASARSVSFGSDANKLRLAYSGTEVTEIRFFSTAFEPLGKANIASWKPGSGSVGPEIFLSEDIPSSVLKAYEEKTPIIAYSVAQVVRRAYISNNNFRNNRGRGILLQGEWVEIANNTFDSTTMPGLLMTSAYGETYNEASPPRHVWIHDNVFTNTNKSPRTACIDHPKPDEVEWDCGDSGASLILGGIVASTEVGNNVADFNKSYGIFDLHIERNRFSDISGPGVVLVGVSKAVVSDNTFENTSTFLNGKLPNFGAVLSGVSAMPPVDLAVVNSESVTVQSDVRVFRNP